MEPLPFTFVAVDFETTGLNPHGGDQICEIGAVRVSPGEEQTFQTLVNPLFPIPEIANSINGITDEMVEHAPTMKQALPGFIDFIGDDLIVAHNIWMDMGFLSLAMHRLDFPFSNLKFVDTLSISRKLYPKLGRHSLSFLRQHFELASENEHRALSDACATAEVLKRQLLTLNGKYGNAKTIFEKLIEFHGPAATFPSKDDLPGDADIELLELCQEAIKSGFAIEIAYQTKKSDEMTYRDIEPWAIIMKGSRFYLSSYCQLRKEHRYFRFDRICHWAKIIPTPIEASSEIPAQ